jgi:hypothetical protein
MLVASDILPGVLGGVGHQRVSDPCVPAGGAGPRRGLPVIPSPRGRRHDGVRGVRSASQPGGATTPARGVMTSTTRADRSSEDRAHATGLVDWSGDGDCGTIR